VVDQATRRRFESTPLLLASTRQVYLLKPHQFLLKPHQLLLKPHQRQRLKLKASKEPSYQQQQHYWHQSNQLCQSSQFYQLCQSSQLSQFYQSSQLSQFYQSSQLSQLCQSSQLSQLSQLLGQP
jgi:hypothetical protein